MAAITGEVKYWVESNKTDPIPKPKNPIQQPVIQLGDRSWSKPSKRTQSKIIKKRARQLRMVTKATKPQLNKSISAAGKLTAKKNIDKTQIKFDFMRLEFIFRGQNFLLSKTRKQG